MNNSLAFEKFKSLESNASSPILKNKSNKLSTTKRLISDISNKFTSSSSEKKKENEKSQLNGERCGNALEAAEARKAEREAKRIEEDKKYSGMKPVQAMFNKSIAARTSENKSVFKANPTVPSVSVSDIKDKVRRKSLIAGGSSRNSIDLDFIPDLPVQSALDVYTKGNCRTLKDKFETDFQLKKNSNLEIVTRPVPAQRSKIGCGGGLPDMFEQQRKRESYVSLNKQKDTEIINKESINSCLDKFEDSNSRKVAREKLTQFTNKQKSFETPKWTQRELDKKKEDENALKRVEDDNKRLENEEAFQKQMQEMGQDRTKFMEPDPGKNSYPKEEKENDTMTNKVKKTGQKKEGSNKLHGLTLPTISSSTFSDMKRKLQEKTQDNEIKKIKDINNKTYTPIRKLKLSPFKDSDSSSKSSTPVPSPNIISTVPKLNDIKKRFVVEKEESPTSYVAFKSKKVKKDNENLSEKVDQEVEQTAEEKKAVVCDNQDDNPKMEESEKRSSKSQMQNYLLSKVLFDDKNKVTKKEEPMEIDLIDETPVNIMDDPYFQEIEKYLSLIGGSDEGKKTNKKKKISDPKKPKKKSLRLKVVELDEIKNKFETKKETQKNITTPGVTSQLLLDKKVNKFKQMFDSSNTNTTSQIPLNKPSNAVRRRSGIISEELLSKFDSPELLEKLKKQREEEREARRISRLQKLEEEQRRLEEEARHEKERLEAERLENEKLKEQEKKELEEEARIAAACEEMMRKEKEKAEARRKREEEIKLRRERNEPAFKKKKVLDRIQHIFDKDINNADPSPQTPQKIIGSIKDKADELFQNKSEGPSGKIPFQDSSLVGMSVNKFKDKFETELSKQDESGPPLKRSEKKKRVPLQTAIDFDSLNVEQQPESASTVSSQNTSEWTWKKKDQGQLAVETTMAIMKSIPNTGNTEKKVRSSNKFRRSSENTDQLLKELHSVSARLGKKDALQEHEIKMKEYDEFIDEIQSFLNEPIQDITECLDEVRREKKNKKVKKKLSPGEKASKAANAKDKKFKELLKFVKSNESFIPPSIHRLIKSDMEYKEFVQVIDKFLSAPDRSVDEIEFKDQIESILDMIDDSLDNSNSGKKNVNGPDITASCVGNKSSSNLPDVVEGGFRSRRRSLIDDSVSSLNTSNSITDFQSEMKKYRSILDSKNVSKISDSKWKIGKVDSSFLQKTDEEDDRNLDGKRVGPPSSYAKNIQNKLVASIHRDSSSTDVIKQERKKKVIVDSFVTKNDETNRGMRDLKQFIYKNRTELPIEVLDFDCSDKELISMVGEFAFSEGDKPLKEEIKIYLEFVNGTPNSAIGDSIKTDHVADMRKKIFESNDANETNELYSAPRRKLVHLENSSSAHNICEPIRRKSIDTKKWEISQNNHSYKSLYPTPSPPVRRALSKSASDATVFKSKPVMNTISDMDPKEREAAILAKYGVKPRPIARDSDSSSSSESESEEEDIKTLISKDPRLYSIYGDRLLSSEDIPRKSRHSEIDSLSSLRNILGTMRQPQAAKISSAQGIKSVFENAQSSEEIPRKSAPKVLKSTSFANIKNIASQQEDDSEEGSPRPSWQHNPSGLSRSSSFHKFKSAIEKGEEESSLQNSNTQVQAELDAIRSCTRLQRLFSINKPSGLSRSRSNSAIDKSEVASDISQARENIKSAFESNHAKVSYGVKLRDDNPKPKSKTQSQSNASPSGKKWVYDTINKYFDVIVEDDESDEDDEDDDEEEDSSSESDLDSNICNEEESEVEIKDFSTIVSSRNNYNITKSKSSAKIRSLISTVMVEKSISVESMNVFKANLNSHLQKSGSNL